MSQGNRHEIENAVEYIIESDGSVESKVSVIKNAVVSGDVSPNEILSEYADEFSTADAIYPMEETKIRNLYNEVKKELSDKNDVEIKSFEEICHPNNIVENSGDVVTQAISIYDDEDRTPEERREDIQELIQEARRDGISVSSEEVTTALENFDEQTNDNGVVDSRGLGSQDTVDLATGIETPTTIHTNTEITYEINTVPDANIDSIDWYIAGEHIGSGEVVNYIHEYAGSQNISVELSDVDGTTDHVNEEVTVDEKPAIEASISGETEVLSGDVVNYSVNIETTNDVIDEITWKLNGVTSGTGNRFDTTFESAGDYTLTAIIEGKQGSKKQVTKEITVNTPTGISVSLNTPDTVVEGEERTIYASVSVENSVIESVKCTVNNSIVDTIETGNNISFEYTFDEEGEYPITFTAKNSEGETDTDVGTVECFVKPEFDWVECDEQVIRHDEVNYSVEYDERLSSEWEVENASLQRVTDTSTLVKFDEENVDTAFITFRVKNNNSSIKEETKEITINDPKIDPVIQYPDTVTEGDLITLSIDGTTVENAEVDSVKWLLNGETFAEGETVETEIYDIGVNELKAEINTNRDISGTATGEIEVTHETDVSAIIVSDGGNTTRDTFYFSGEKSKTEHTEIKSFEWEVTDNNGTTQKTGKRIEKDYDTPGEYDIILTVESVDGDIDTATESVEVNQYTDVDAVISGSDTVIVGEEAEYTAIESKPTNTNIDTYTWKLNNTEVATGERFSEVFGNPGHFTLELEAKTVTDDVDTDTVNVVVSTPDSLIRPDFEVETDDPRVGDAVSISSQPTEVENGTIKKCEWVIDNEVVDSNNKNINKVFNEYGEKQVQLKIKTYDGVEDGITKTIYIAPNLSDPPYKPITNNDKKADVFGRAVELYQDDAMDIDDKNDVAAILIHEAKSASIDVSRDEIKEHVLSILDDVDGVIDIPDANNVDINVETSESTESNGDGNWDVSSDDGEEQVEKQATIDEEFSTGDSADSTNSERGELPEDGEETSSDAFDVSTSKSSNDEKRQADLSTEEFTTKSNESSSNESGDENGSKDKFVIKDAVNEEIKSTHKDLPAVLEREENIRIWDVEPVKEYSDYRGYLYSLEKHKIKGNGVVEERQKENEDEKIDAGVESNSGGGDVTNRSPIVDDSVDIEEVEDDDRHKQIRISPETYDIGDGVFAMPNYTQDLLDFEYVLQEDDPLVPDNTNAAGIIAGKNGKYITIAKVEGIDWSILPGDQKKQIIDSYESHFLSGLDSHIQVLSIPKRFDIREHIDLVNTVLEENQDNQDEMLMNIGRSIYPNWVENFMSDNDMKERQFYVVVTLSAEQLQDFKPGKESITAQLIDMPVIGNFVSRFADDEESDITRYQILRELNKRMGRVKSSLRRMNVNVDRVTDRDEVLSVLYEYYHEESPENEVFPTGPFTELEDDPTLAGMDMGGIVDDYEELNADED